MSEVAIEMTSTKTSSVVYRLVEFTGMAIVAGGMVIAAVTAPAEATNDQAVAAAVQVAP